MLVQCMNHKHDTQAHELIRQAEGWPCKTACIGPIDWPTDAVSDASERLDLYQRAFIHLFDNPATNADFLHVVRWAGNVLIDTLATDGF